MTCRIGKDSSVPGDVVVSSSVGGSGDGFLAINFPEIPDGEVPIESNDFTGASGFDDSAWAWVLTFSTDRCFALFDVGPAFPPPSVAILQEICNTLLCF